MEKSFITLPPDLCDAQLLMRPQNFEFGSAFKDFDTYPISEQRMLRQACTYVQYSQSLGFKHPALLNTSPWV